MRINVLKSTVFSAMKNNKDTPTRGQKPPDASLPPLPAEAAKKTKAAGSQPAASTSGTPRKSKERKKKSQSGKGKKGAISAGAGLPPSRPPSDGSCRNLVAASDVLQGQLGPVMKTSAAKKYFLVDPVTAAAAIIASAGPSGKDYTDNTSVRSNPPIDFECPNVVVENSRSTRRRW
jgi:hypothetical protein